MEDEEGRLTAHKSTYFKELWRDKAGKLHRLNGPAMITLSSGDMTWYRHGKLHRDDGPALDWPSDGTEEWYRDGKLYEPTAHELIAWKMKKKEG